MVYDNAEVYEDAFSWKIIEDPTFGKYIVGGEMAGSRAYVSEDDAGKSVITLELNVDHNDQRYFFDFTSKDSFFNDNTEEIRNRTIDSIVFSDTFNIENQGAISPT